MRGSREDHKLKKHHGVRDASLDGKLRQSCQRLKSAVVFNGVDTESMSDHLVPPRTSRWSAAAAAATGLPRPVQRTLPLVPCRSGDPGRWPIALQAEKRRVAEGQAYENHAYSTSRTIRRGLCRLLCFCQLPNKRRGFGSSRTNIVAEFSS